MVEESRSVVGIEPMTGSRSRSRTKTSPITIWTLLRHQLPHAAYVPPRRRRRREVDHRVVIGEVDAALGVNRLVMVTLDVGVGVGVRRTKRRLIIAAAVAVGVGSRRRRRESKRSRGRAYRDHRETRERSQATAKIRDRTRTATAGVVSLQEQMLLVRRDYVVVVLLRSVGKKLGLGMSGMGLSLVVATSLIRAGENCAIGETIANTITITADGAFDHIARLACGIVANGGAGDSCSRCRLKNRAGSVDVFLAVAVVILNSSMVRVARIQVAGLLQLGGRASRIGRPGLLLLLLE